MLQLNLIFSCWLADRCYLWPLVFLPIWFPQTHVPRTTAEHQWQFFKWWENGKCSAWTTSHCGHSLPPLSSSGPITDSSDPTLKPLSLWLEVIFIELTNFFISMQFEAGACAASAFVSSRCPSWPGFRNGLHKDRGDLRRLDRGHLNLAHLPYAQLLWTLIMYFHDSDNVHFFYMMEGQTRRLTLWSRCTYYKSGGKRKRRRGKQIKKNMTWNFKSWNFLLLHLSTSPSFSTVHRMVEGKKGRSTGAMWAFQAFQKLTKCAAICCLPQLPSREP